MLRTGAVWLDRDEMEFRLLERFHLTRCPLFGPNRGWKVVQVAFGGRGLAGTLQTW